MAKTFEERVEAAREAFIRMHSAPAGREKKEKEEVRKWSYDPEAASQIRRSQTRIILGDEAKPVVPFPLEFAKRGY